MNRALWIVQVLLAGVFAASGLSKITMSRERLIATGQASVMVFPCRLYG